VAARPTPSTYGRPSMVPARTRLEAGMGLAKLIPLAQKEGNSKKPVYQMHKWWARRLGVNFRFLLLGATTPSTTREATVWKEFFESETARTITVLDPFMGGGTSIVEATKLGANAIGVDLDPLAWFIVSNQVGSFDEPGFSAEWDAVRRDLEGPISRYFQTRVAGKLAPVIYNFWVEIIPCAKCGHEFEGHIHYLLYAKKKQYGAGPPRMGFCRKCHEPAGLRSGQKNIHCACGEVTPVDNGNIRLGKYTCPSCQHKGHISDLPTERLPLKHKLFAIEYVDPATGDRAYKKADAHDLELYEAAEAELAKVGAELPLPTQAIPETGRSDPRPISLGYKRYSDLFTRRQLLCLGLILQRIKKVENQAHRELLLLAFSDSLACNNWFCSYAFGYQKLTPLFGLHAFRRISRPVEGNVWGTSIGRGSFSSCVEKVLRGKRFAAKPFEYEYGNGRPERREATRPAQTKLLHDVKAMSTAKEQVAHLAVADSRDLSWIPKGTVDLVLTDPPYYDNLAYSELSDFYYVWLRDHVHWPKPQTADHSPMEASLFVREAADEEHAKYIEGLSSAFKGCRHAIKENGLLVFTFHHANVKAWESLALALRRGDFRVTNCFPILAEGRSGFHSDHGNLKWDVVFVCRPGRPKNGPSMKAGPARKWLDSRLNRWSVDADSSGQGFGEADKRSLAFGLTTAYLTLVASGDEIVKPALASLEKRYPFKRYGRVKFALED
jgi:putative DNA methylase